MADEPIHILTSVHVLRRELDRVKDVVEDVKAGVESNRLGIEHNRIGIEHNRLGIEHNRVGIEHVQAVMSEQFMAVQAQNQEILTLLKGRVVASKRLDRVEERVTALEAGEVRDG